MAKMRAVQVPSAKGPLRMVEREIPEPGPGWVRIRVEACGICHADSYVKEGLWPGIQYPRVPGHEVAGVIDALGSGVAGWKPGQRVGVGWHGGHCGYCENCRRGDFLFCTVERRVTAITQDGGYADYMLAPAVALALIPDELSAPEAGLCSAPESPPSIRCAVAARETATSSRSWESAASAIWESNSRSRWDSAPWPSHAERTKHRWRRN
jgi:D-arabinose 1-dehydrogenase-like Zn-dependent alcohol dehydrogenase